LGKAYTYLRPIQTVWRGNHGCGTGLWTPRFGGPGLPALDLQRDLVEVAPSNRPRSIGLAEDGLVLLPADPAFISRLHPFHLYQLARDEVFSA